MIKAARSGSQLGGDGVGRRRDMENCQRKLFFPLAQVECRDCRGVFHRARRQTLQTLVLKSH